MFAQCQGDFGFLVQSMPVGAVAFGLPVNESMIIV